MRLEKFLYEATQQLLAAGIATARLDILILLEDCLGVDRAHLIAHPERELTVAQQAWLTASVQKRQKHMPLAYIRRKAAFYGREFIVSPDVLVPRPESEAIIDRVKHIVDPNTSCRVADVGTGSGCLGVTVALELPKADIHLIDISPPALAIAKKNATILGAQNIQYIQNDLLAGLTDAYDIILANLPYVPENYPINTAAHFEPGLALFAGADGLSLYRMFWQQIAALPYEPAHIITESLIEQHGAVLQLAKQVGYAMSQKDGLIQHFVPHKAV